MKPGDSTECPRCGSFLSRVIESRAAYFHGHLIRVRKRECRHCGYRGSRFKTVEISDSDVRWPASRDRESAIEEHGIPEENNPHVGLGFQGSQEVFG